MKRLLPLICVVAVAWLSGCSAGDTSGSQIEETEANRTTQETELKGAGGGTVNTTTAPPPLPPPPAP